MKLPKRFYISPDKERVWCAPKGVGSCKRQTNKEICELVYAEHSGDQNCIWRNGKCMPGPKCHDTGGRIKGAIKNGLEYYCSSYRKNGVAITPDNKKFKDPCSSDNPAALRPQGYSIRRHKQIVKAMQKIDKQKKKVAKRRNKAEKKRRKFQQKLEKKRRKFQQKLEKKRRKQSQNKYSRNSLFASQNNYLRNSHYTSSNSKRNAYGTRRIGKYDPPFEKRFHF